MSMDSILEALLEPRLGDRTPVREILAGAYWTYVQSRFGGLSSTLRDRDPQHGDGGGPLFSAGELLGRPAGEVAALVRSGHPVARSIGLATLNSLVELDESRCVEKGAFDLLAERGAGRDVAVVGHFPFVPKLREKVRNLWVLEREPRPGDLPATEAPDILPRAEVVCLTGTSLLNGTLQGLLAHCRGAFVVLTGPSSPLDPRLFDFGIQAICGARVADAEGIRPYVAQGASFRQLRPHGVRLLALVAPGGLPHLPAPFPGANP